MLPASDTGGLIVAEHHVLGPGEAGVAAPAAEVVGVPAVLLRPHVVLGEDELVAGGTAGDAQVAGEVSATEEVAIRVIVEIVHKDVSAVVTSEAPRMPV